jgi:MFS transporter, PAT family, beta-lactamase induction signal transducer AmpG
VKIVLLSVLYFAQGLPFGFQAFALPVYLRESGRSLVAIGFLGALSLPWALKPLWAPLVDRYGATRRAWIVPLMLGLAACCAAAGLVDASTSGGLAALLALVFAMNLLAATQDIAVDGLAVDLLSGGELGMGNAAQVVGYKIGMLVGGGLFVWASAYVSWRLLLPAMAALVLACMSVALAMPAARTRTHAPAPLGAIVRRLVAALATPGNATLLAFLVTYKVGESMADTMWRPFLVDAGFGKEFIGLATGVYGMWASIAGSFGGGYLATRLPLMTALWIPAAARVAPLVAQAWVALHPSRGGVIAVTCLEHLAGGALTTVVFALMMSRTDKKIGATHYTALAAVEVVGKFPGGWISGPLATWLGYSATYAIAAGITAGLLLFLIPLGRAAPSDRAR